MATPRLKGGPELMARLSSVVAARPEMTRAWAHDAASRIRSEAPHRTGKLRSSIAEGEKRGKGVVTGAWYGVILDRGTKSYPITPKKSSTLRFQYRGRTVFSKKVTRKRLRRRPFITRGAQEALSGLPMAAVIVKAWSRKSARGRKSSLAL